MTYFITDYKLTTICWVFLQAMTTQQQQQFSFLQDSQLPVVAPQQQQHPAPQQVPPELDSSSPHMDPAVVVVQSQAPGPLPNLHQHLGPHINGQPTQPPHIPSTIAQHHHMMAQVQAADLTNKGGI